MVGRGDYNAERAVAVTSDYGTERASGLWLLELALNMKTPTIYDPDPTDPDKRVQNPEATLAAKEKQKLIKEKFRSWVFSDPDRTERLVRIYNDTYNNLRPRQFDGSHLDFPGMSQAIALRPHQKDAVWRCISGGNTLLAHVVGAGKTYTMAAAAMKMKQAGLVQKSLLCVPNHLLEQFAREFQQLYPNAKVLVAGKDDFTKERRKYLTAKIASGDWDAIIVTHSSFERIGMSREFQQQFLREQIAEYDQLLTDRAGDRHGKANRNILKSLEKQKAAREAKLKDLLAEDKKDDGLVFDELGIDNILIDEFQQYNDSCSFCSCVGRGLRRREVFQRRCSGRSARHKSRLSSVRWRGSWCRQPTGQRRIVPVARAPRQLPQPLQLRRVRPARVTRARVRARNAPVLDPTRLHPVVERRAVHFQLGGQFRC